MDETVLGWARAGALCPAGVTSHKVDAFDLLLVDSRKAPDARDRLRWQVACFELGLDFVPTAPATAISQADGVHIATKHAATLSEGLERLAGMGQLTLGLTWSSDHGSQSTPENGRAWLAQRRRLHHREAAQKASATVLLDRLDCPGTGTTTREYRKRLERDVLLPRAQFKDALRHLAAKAAALEAGTVSLGVTGLWPPFSFVQPFSGNACPWD